MVVLKEGELEILENILDARRELCQGDSDDYPALYSAATELRVLRDIDAALRRKAKIH
jgi:hypothetical protein